MRQPVDVLTRSVAKQVLLYCNQAKIQLHYSIAIACCKHPQYRPQQSTIVVLYGLSKMFKTH